MSSWIDVAGSFIIGGIIILIMANLNIYINTSSAENLYTNIVQDNMASTVNILEHDFYRMGYGINNGRIIEADSNSIKFISDLNNSGVYDTVAYSVGTTSDLSGTQNPNDKPLYRTLNNGSPKYTESVTNFDLSYYDSLGNKFNYASLNSSTIRSKIRIIKIYLKIESTEPVDGVYQSAEWERKIFPKNY